MNEEEHKSLMAGMALASLKLMPEKNRQVCSKFVLKQLADNGSLSEDDYRAILDYELKFVTNKK